MNAYDLPEPARKLNAEDDFVLRDILGLIRDQILWVLGIAAAIIILAVIYARTSTPIYSADALIRVERPNSNTAPSTSTGVAMTEASGQLPTEAEMEIIKSRRVLEPVVEQFKLNISSQPKRFPIVGNMIARFATAGHPAPALFGLSEYAWGGEELDIGSLTVPEGFEGVPLTLKALGENRYELLGPRGQVLLSGQAGQLATQGDTSMLLNRLVARPGTRFTVKRENELDAIQGLAGAIGVGERGKSTGLVQISMQGASPEMITNITNAVAMSYLNQHIARRQEEASKMLAFLNGELPGLRAEVKRTESRLSDYQAKAGSFQPSAEAQTYLSGGIDYERQIAALKMQRLQLLQRFTTDSPEVRTLDSQIGELRGQKDRFEQRFQTLPSAQREAVGYTRDANVASSIYTSLLNRTQELSVNRAGTVGNVQVVDYALRPMAPIKPKQALIISAGVALGLIAGVLFAFVKRNFFTGVEDPEAVERNFHLPIFGAVMFSAEQSNWDDAGVPDHAVTAWQRFARSLNLPWQPSLAARESKSAPRHKPLLAKVCPYDASVEGLRGFRTALQFGLVDAPNKVVAITSPAPASGKSFVSANLAVLLAETGKNVLLVDADLRRGRLSDYFGRSHVGGLTEMLSGQISLAEAAQPTAIAGLTFIPAGAYPPNPSEMLTTSYFRQLLDQFDKRYDIVIVDTPPVLAVTDAAIIANAVGTTVVVLRAGAHTEREIAETLKKLSRARARVMGGVFNALSNRRGASESMYKYADYYQPETVNH